MAKSKKLTNWKKFMTDFHIEILNLNLEVSNTHELDKAVNNLTVAIQRNLKSNTKIIPD